MDELEFRRRVYANPDTTDREVIEAAKSDPAKQAFWQEQKAQDSALLEVMKIPVPEDMAHKLIWQQTANEFVRHKKRSRWYVAMAASVAFAVGISLTLFNRAEVSLGNEALVHMQYAAAEQSHSGLPVDLTQVNAKLAGFGASLTDMVGNVKVANYCHLNNVRSLHLIMETDQGLMSVFVVPHRKDIVLPDAFSNDTFHGEAVKMQRANILVVGDKRADLTPVMQEVKSKIQFSA
ncbi:DUF3379 family protein [Alteromonas sp. H39]|uniref:DUF3379 family protein n=1 Tax=Alteromonas sp. H39 TaxID=3389876 RepID=UPI0039DF30B8